ncbi:DUF2306 domain-containing protein [Pseudophaeobacter leonis]|uniref:DUF2306 domain-containing protein n=1 Tax=Pseudophaeobacter leonis TaxID=1144477 RepID=UPI001F4D6CC9|nr:DUF2306 domain-containing protein [Pseudophaeobacter leonis]
MIALASWRFLVLGVELSMPFVAYHALERPVAFYLHVGLAPVALALLPFQFWRGLRRRRPGWHRWIGRGYGVAILLSGLGGLKMAIGTTSGPVAGLGFGLLALLWLGVTGRGIWLAMQGRIADHRRWMIRLGALTFAAVTLRLYLPLLFATLGEEAGYSLVAWVSWVPNALLAEWFIRRKGKAAMARQPV